MKDDIEWEKENAGVIVRRATALLKVELHLSFLWLRLRICVNILLDFLTFPIQNLLCRRTFSTFQFARYQLSSEHLQLAKGSLLTSVDRSSHVLFLASCLVFCN